MSHRASPLRQHHRPAAEPGHPALGRDEPDGRHLAHLRRGIAQPDALQLSASTGRTTRPRTARGSTSPRRCSTPTPRPSPATSTGSRATRWATTTPIPRTPIATSGPARSTTSRGRRAASPTAATSTGKATGTRHPDRGVDHLRGQRPRLHAPPLVGERPGRDLSRLHREDPLPEGAGHHGRRAAAGLRVRPVRRPVPRPVHRRAAGQRLGLQHGRLLRPRVALQLLRQARRRRSTSSRCSSASCTRINIEVILDVVFNHTREGNHFGPTISFRGLDNNIYYMLAPQARVLQRLHRLRQHAELQPPGRPQVHPRLPALLGHRDARRRLPVRPGGGLRHRRRPAGEGEDADHPRDRDRPGPLADQADRRALEHPPVPARVVLRPPLGRVERQVPRHGAQVRQGRPGRRRRAGHAASPARTTCSPPTPSPSARRSTASTSSPATTASRSTTSSPTTRSTTSATARTTATAPTTTRAGTAATRGSSSTPTCPTSRSSRSRTSGASRSRTS